MLLYARLSLTGVGDVMVWDREDWWLGRGEIDIWGEGFTVIRDS